eukprot:scaffold28872_cov55-Phaeocystis_antarctica.AAC.5
MWLFSVAVISRSETPAVRASRTYSAGVSRPAARSARIMSASGEATGTAGSVNAARRAEAVNRASAAARKLSLMLLHALAVAPVPKVEGGGEHGPKGATVNRPCSTCTTAIEYA